MKNLLSLLIWGLAVAAVEGFRAVLTAALDAALWVLRR
jgi:hypothetical protein